MEMFAPTDSPQDGVSASDCFWGRQQFTDACGLDKVATVLSMYRCAVMLVAAVAAAGLRAAASGAGCRRRQR